MNLFKKCNVKSSQQRSGKMPRMCLIYKGLTAFPPTPYHLVSTESEATSIHPIARTEIFGHSVVRPGAGTRKLWPFLSPVFTNLPRGRVFSETTLSEKARRAYSRNTQYAVILGPLDTLLEGFAEGNLNVRFS
jgi:hypothetical protein